MFNADGKPVLVDKGLITGLYPVPEFDVGVRLSFFIFQVPGNLS